TITLPGQPDSIAIAPSGDYAAVIIENERDEDVNDGEIPQLPSGSLTIVDIDGEPAGGTTRSVALTGLAGGAPTDAEPEYVAINTADQAVVSLQENNHLAIIDLADGTVVNHFSAGSVEIDQVDTEDNGIIELTGTVNMAREPDALAWLSDDLFATANEGDY